MARILVVDDEEGLREFLVEVLADEGHDVTEARDGAEGIALLEASAFDLVVTDLKMPRVSGMALLARSRALQPDAEVVVLTAHGSVETAVEAMKAGAFDYLEKPLSGPAELRLVAARALERRQHRTELERAQRDAPSLPRLSHGAKSMEPVERALRKVAATDATVLLTGESGTGKEVAARSVHAWSLRARGAFVAINCAALSESLLESELFGHEKGAFTGATGTQRGRIELADGGTFFLDEIGELKLELQAKLLRVVQERRLERVGGRRSIAVDVRWIAATNRHLPAMVAEGRFREDLYHRLAVFPVRLPPLRERVEDILPIADELLAGVTRRLNRGPLSLSPEARRYLEGARWTGNVRELANALERAAILSDGSELSASSFGGGAEAGQPPARATPRPGATLDELERDAIAAALRDAGGNRKDAARSLGIGVRTLYEKLKRYGLS